MTLPDVSYDAFFEYTHQFDCFLICFSLTVFLFHFYALYNCIVSDDEDADDVVEEGNNNGNDQPTTTTETTATTAAGAKKSPTSAGKNKRSVPVPAVAPGKDNEGEGKTLDGTMRRKRQRT